MGHATRSASAAAGGRDHCGACGEVQRARRPGRRQLPASREQQRDDACVRLSRSQRLAQRLLLPQRALRLPQRLDGLVVAVVAGPRARRASKRSREEQLPAHGPAGHSGASVGEVPAVETLRGSGEGVGRARSVPQPRAEAHHGLGRLGGPRGRLAEQPAERSHAGRADTVGGVGECGEGGAAGSLVRRGGEGEKARQREGRCGVGGRAVGRRVLQVPAEGSANLGSAVVAWRASGAERGVLGLRGLGGCVLQVRQVPGVRAAASAQPAGGALGG
eukprot:scaffold13767_cov97-Isochrysis_galbana.AAC.4